VFTSHSLSLDEEEDEEDGWMDEWMDEWMGDGRPSTQCKTNPPLYDNTPRPTMTNDDDDDHGRRQELFLDMLGEEASKASGRRKTLKARACPPAC
jgi:hypothetical protein